MSLDALLTLDTIEVMENYIDKIRLNEELRDVVDLAYVIENQSIIIYEIRPHFTIPAYKVESHIAKATFIKAKNCWKVYWLRANLKWHVYDPQPTVKTLQEFVELVEKDEHGCFWG